MSVLRRICGITRWDWRRNIDIKHDLGLILDIVQRLQRRRMTYFGHVARMDNNRYPNILLHGYGSGQHARGRPKKKWVDNIKELGLYRHGDINQRSNETCRRSEYVEEHCSEPGLPVCGDFVIVAEALSQLFVTRSHVWWLFAGGKLRLMSHTQQSWATICTQLYRATNLPRQLSVFHWQN